MITNVAGIKLIAEFEGLRLKAYPDPGSGGAPWTIGYGHTKGVKPGDTCTTEQAENWLKADVGDAETAVNALSLSLSANQFAALVSFTYNCGAGNLRKLLSKGLDAVPDRLLLFNRAAGKVLHGLTRRRTAERQLFLTEE
jgi:lysozyme